MHSYLVIATRGRAAAVTELVDWLQRQTRQPGVTVVAGVEPADLEGLEHHLSLELGRLRLLTTRRAGLCTQRNAALDWIANMERECPSRDGYFVAFMDDDFRPADDWLARCHDAFVQQPRLAALTGRVLADGVHGQPLTSPLAREFIDGRLAPRPHWAGGSRSMELASMYGCNMAFRDLVVRNCRFDENLPLYGWQEDQDFTTQARKFGRTLYIPECRGVHLGIASGRVSGVRFGYSQIANPYYLMRKGTMRAGKGLRFVVRHLLANSTRSLRVHPRVDYNGRLRGNLMAIGDLLRGRCDPQRVLDLD
jgi:glycosyltransferase involved in cell wall biosynthesis